MLFPMEWDTRRGLLREHSWHSSTRIAFYVLDEIPALLFFSVYASVALFWADIYLSAIEHQRFFNLVLRPAHAAVNLVRAATGTGRETVRF